MFCQMPVDRQILGPYNTTVASCTLISTSLYLVPVETKIRQPPPPPPPVRRRFVKCPS